MSSSYGFDGQMQHLIDSDLKSEETQTSRQSPFSPTARLQACIQQSSFLLGQSFLIFQRQLAQLDHHAQILNQKRSFRQKQSLAYRGNLSNNSTHFRPLVLKSNTARGFDIY